MTVFIGGLLFLWGGLIIYSALFKMKKTDYKDDSRIGASGLIELEFLSKLLNKLPLGVVRGIIISVGLSFATLGVFIL